MKKLFVTCLVAIFATAVFGQTKILIPTLDLPKCVHDWVKKNMKDYRIDKAYKIENKVDKTVVISYTAKLTKGKDVQWISSDAACKKVKKITMTEKDTDPPKPMPPVNTGDKEKADENPPQPK